MKVDTIEASQWFIKFVKKINKELKINPIINIVEGKFGGEAGGRTVWLSIEPTMSRVQIKWLLSHELRHVWQDKFPLDRLYREEDREKLISILCRVEGLSKTKISKKVRKKILKKYHDLLPEEIDANIYAYHKTRYNHLTGGY